MSSQDNENENDDENDNDNESENGVPGDYAFTEGCGWAYYSCNDIVGDCVILQPVELPAAGVVYGLQFRGEDELWAWCGEGLVRWGFGVKSRGGRGVGRL